MSPSLTTLAAHLSQQQFGNPELFSLALATSSVTAG